MIFPPPRFVVVDDKKDHLSAILGAFQELGAPCLGLHYDARDGLGTAARSHLRGVRVLCLDLHLTDVLATTDPTRHFGVIAELLETNISSTGGPFILIVWTAHEEEAEHLGDYLDSAFGTSVSHARPLNILPLAKTSFIDKRDGELLSGAAESLREALLNAVNDVPQLAALLEWETNVQAATGATLSALVGSVPEDQRSIAHVATGLGAVLAHLGTAASGEDNAKSDPRTAVSSALAPLLADRIIHRDSAEQFSDQWKDALTWDRGPSLQLESKATFNRMVHIAAASPSTVQADAWGAVVELPTVWRNDSNLQERFAISQAQLATGEFKLGSDTLRNPRLIRIGAVCDYVRNRPGPLTYLLATEAPLTPKPGKLPASVWRSPALLLDPAEEPFELRVSARFPTTATSGEVANWKPVYRLREQLLMHLISHASNHLSRPGILQL